MPKCINWSSYCFVWSLTIFSPFLPSEIGWHPNASAISYNGWYYGLVYSYFPWLYLVLWARSFWDAQREKEHLVTIDKFPWMTPECWRNQSDHRTFNNCVISACCGLSCFSHRVNGKNHRIPSLCIVLWAIHNFRSISQVSAHRGRDWILRTTFILWTSDCNYWMSHT